jgi:hypothetical protein
MRRTWIFLLGALVWTGCVKPATWSRAGVDTALPGSLVLDAGPEWSRRTGGTDSPNHEVWTAEGLPLDQLHFYSGLAPGQPLALAGQRAALQVPTFREGLQPHEVVELYETVATLDGSTFQREKLSPAHFAGGEGFRFEFTLIRSTDQVTLRGAGFGAVRGGKLYLVVYLAPRLHFFDQHIHEVETMVASARIRG